MGSWSLQKMHRSLRHRDGNADTEGYAFGYRTEEKVRIGVADDEAFCFFYADNLNPSGRWGGAGAFFCPFMMNIFLQIWMGFFLWRLSGIKWEALERKSASMKEEIAQAVGQECPVWQNVAASCIFIRRWRIWAEVFLKTCGVISGRGLPHTEAEPSSAISH